MQNLIDLLDRSGLTRRELASALGVSERTTYWDDPPKYALAYLEQHIELENHRRLVHALKAVL